MGSNDLCKIAEGPDVYSCKTFIVTDGLLHKKLRCVNLGGDRNSSLLEEYHLARETLMQLTEACDVHRDNSAEIV